MNIINGNVEITNEVGTKADAKAPIISLFGGTGMSKDIIEFEKTQELALVA